MKKAVVLGGTGGMGQALVKELLARGIPTTAFGRSEEKLHRLHQEHQDKANLLSIFAGDAFKKQDVIEASKGADVIFHSVNVPYPEWEDKLVKLAESIMEAAAAINAKVVVIDNIYPYGFSQMEKITEEHPKMPHTKKGKIRLQVENKIMKAHQEGTPALITRLPDFYGPNSESSILNMTLQSIALGKSGVYVGKKDIEREFVYLPDGAKAVVELAEKEDAYGENWHIPGAGTITGEEIIRIAQKAANRGEMTIRPIGRKMFFLLGIFNPLMKEVREMLYLTENPVILNGDKYIGNIGSIPATSYEEGIKATIRSFQTNSEL